MLHITGIGTMVKENRHLFLHQGCYPKFKGYAYAQLHKMTSKNPVGMRKAIRAEHGFDVKFAYHLVRLLSECEQLLRYVPEPGWVLDIRQNREQLKAIRRGEMTEEEVRKWASEKESHLEKLYADTKLPERPDEVRLKQLLVNCLEHHYGSLEKAIVVPDKQTQALVQIREILDKAGV